MDNLKIRIGGYRLANYVFCLSFLCTDKVFDKEWRMTSLNLYVLTSTTNC